MDNILGAIIPGIRGGRGARGGRGGRGARGARGGAARGGRGAGAVGAGQPARGGRGGGGAAPARGRGRGGGGGGGPAAPPVPPNNVLPVGFYQDAQGFFEDGDAMAPINNAAVFDDAEVDYDNPIPAYQRPLLPLGPTPVQPLTRPFPLLEQLRNNRPTNLQPPPVDPEPIPGFLMPPGIFPTNNVYDDPNYDGDAVQNVGWAAVRRVINQFVRVAGQPLPNLRAYRLTITLRDDTPMWTINKRAVWFLMLWSVINFFNAAQYRTTFFRVITRLNMEAWMMQEQQGMPNMFQRQRSASYTIPDVHAPGSPIFLVNEYSQRFSPWMDAVNQRADTSANLMYLIKSIDIMVISTDANGGCLRTSSHLARQCCTPTGDLMWCPTSTNNNCAFGAIMLALQKKFPEKRADFRLAPAVMQHIRRECRLERGAMVPCNQDVFRQLLQCIVDHLRTLHIKLSMHVYSPPDRLPVFEVECTPTEPLPAALQVDGQLPSATLHLMLYEQHYYSLISTDFSNTNRCLFCKRVYKNKHTCSASRTSFFQHRLLPPTVPPLDMHDVGGGQDLWIDLSEQRINECKFEPGDPEPLEVTLDIETAALVDETDPYGLQHKVYNIGLILNDESERLFYGRDCVQQLLQDIKATPQKYCGTWVAHHGGRFDFFYMLRLVIAQDPFFKVENVLFKNNALLSCVVQMPSLEGDNNKFKFWDMGRFYTRSLGSMCKDFGLDAQDTKTSFPHKFLTSWERVLDRAGVDPPDRSFYPMKDQLANPSPIPEYPPGYRWVCYEESTKYLRIDVRSLRIVSRRFRQAISEWYKVSPLQFVTLSQMAYHLWRLKLVDRFPYRVHRVINRAEDAIFRAALYGGRVSMTRWCFLSKMFAQIMGTLKTKDGQPLPADVEISTLGEKAYTDVPFESIQDFCLPLDANSLYAFTMTSAWSGFRYPLGRAQRIDPPYDWQTLSNRLYMAKLTYEAPQDLAWPILPRRDKDGSVHWDLRNNSEGSWYCSPEVELARRHGYRMQIQEVVAWPETGDIFDDFIHTGHEMRRVGKATNNPVLNQTGKLINNNGYGITAMREHRSAVAAVYTPKDVSAFFSKHSWTGFTNMGEMLILEGERLTNDVTIASNIARCPHIGAFVTSFARVHMTRMLEAIDPTLKDPKSKPIYYDTDSMHVDAETAQQLRDKGFVGNEPGQLKNDIEGLFDEKAKTVLEFNVAKKFYFAVYVRSDQSVGVSIHSKGFPIQYITQKMMTKAMDDPKYTQQVAFESLVSTGIRLQGNGPRRAMSHYEVVQTRTLGKTRYTDGERLDNGYYHIHREQPSPSPEAAPADDDGMMDLFGDVEGHDDNDEDFQGLLASLNRQLAETSDDMQIAQGREDPQLERMMILEDMSLPPDEGD